MTTLFSSAFKAELSSILVCSSLFFFVAFLKLVIDKSGVLYIGKTRIGDSAEDESQIVLKDRVTQWTRGKKQPWSVDVEADEKVDYGSIVPVIARLKELDVSMNLVIRPKPK